MSLCRVVKLAPEYSRASHDFAREGIYLKSFHERKVDHQPSITHSRTGDGVSSAPHAYAQIFGSRKFQGRTNICDRDTPRNQGGPPIDHSIPDAT
jgi:hypothetical protein